MYGWCTKCRDKYPEEYTWVVSIFILRVDLILILRATSIFHSMSSSDFSSSNLTGNNCTYCGGSIEDNYPPAGELDHQDHPLYHPSISQTVRWTWSTRLTFVSSFFNYLLTKIILYQQLSTSRWTGSPTSSFISSFISSSLSSFIINYPPSGDQYSPVYQSSFTKRNIFFKLSFFSDCRGGPLLPLWHHRLLHAQRETMRQVQSKFLLKKNAHQDAQWQWTETQGFGFSLDRFFRGRMWQDLVGWGGGGGGESEQMSEWFSSEWFSKSGFQWGFERVCRIVWKSLQKAAVKYHLVKLVNQKSSGCF